MKHPWISITNWFENFMAKHPAAADFFNWYEPDVDPSDPASYPEEHAEFWHDDGFTIQVQQISQIERLIA